MFDMPYIYYGDQPGDVLEKVKAVLSEFKTAVRDNAIAKQLSLGFVSALKPCNLLVILDRQSLHFSFTDRNAGGSPRKIFIEKQQEAFAPIAVAQAAVNEFQFERPLTLRLDASILTQDSVERAFTISGLASEYVLDVWREFKKMRTPDNFEHLQPSLDRFMNDHPDYAKNIFVMMRFRNAAHFGKIHSAIVAELASYGLKAHRADDRVYPEDDDLWDNICVYMAGCKYGIAVFEDFDDREFNPNVPLEYGMMRAWGKRVLLLKEQRMPRLPSDVTGKLYKSFDMMNIEGSIKTQIEVWIKKDLKI